MTRESCEKSYGTIGFQYRKRYEVTCDWHGSTPRRRVAVTFQYRKRYEVTCDSSKEVYSVSTFAFQYRKRYEVTCDLESGLGARAIASCFNTASGMRSHATTKYGRKRQMFV